MDSWDCWEQPPDILGNLHLAMNTDSHFPFFFSGSYRKPPRVQLVNHQAKWAIYTSSQSLKNYRMVYQIPDGISDSHSTVTGWLNMVKVKFHKISYIPLAAKSKIPVGRGRIFVGHSPWISGHQWIETQLGTCRTLWQGESGPFKRLQCIKIMW